ncbi:hypothetical protein BC829DRAFT_446521 [Chytridium lagenaria]|nr:hypothetical protein BC829DRAFT_446521 [Chytridium lagenaria]
MTMTLVVEDEAGMRGFIHHRHDAAAGHGTRKMQQAKLKLRGTPVRDNDARKIVFEKDKISMVLSNLPSMNSNIADPARHEKVLSFLESQISHHPVAAAYMLDDLHAFMIVQTKIISLALRFAGLLISKSPIGSDQAFTTLLDFHAAILEKVSSLLTSHETSPNYFMVP